MSTVVDYGTLDPDKGIYGLYNDFFVRITRTGAAVFKLKYRIRVSLPNVPGFDPIVLPDITPNSSDQSVVNPVQVLQDTFFKAQVIGSEFGLDIDISDGAFKDVLSNAYNLVRIEVGETFATAADLPPVFQGYDNSDDFWFYNGYENIGRPPINVDYSNYRDADWYDSIPIKLPIVNKFPRVNVSGVDDLNKICFPSQIVRVDDTYVPIEKVTSLYDLDGNLIITVTDPITGLSDDGYWIIPSGVNQIGSSESRIDVSIRYENTTAGTIDSEIISYNRDTCTKNPRYRLRWFNRYNGLDYLNFWGRTDIFEVYKRGKVVLTSGVNSSAATFGDIKPIANAEKYDFGTSTSIRYVLRTSWINENEIESLRDLYKSRNVIMYDEDNNIIPVLVRGSGYQIKDVKNELVKVEVTVEVANLSKIQTQ